MSKVIQVILIAAMSVGSSVAHAGSGPTGGATELTQMLNNTELLSLNSQAYDQWLEQVRTQKNTYDTLQNSITNLKTYPSGGLAQMLAPYIPIINALQGLLDSLQSMKSASQETEDMIRGRIKEAVGLNLPLQEYLKKEIVLADKRGGIYKARIDQDLAKIDNLRARASQLTSMTNRTNSLVGNLQGLQLLNQQSTMQVGELMEIKAALLEQRVASNQARVLEEAEQAGKAAVQRVTAAAAAARRARNEGLVVTVPPPWQKPILSTTTTP